MDKKKIIIAGGLAVLMIFAVIFFIFFSEKEVPTHLFAEGISSSEIEISWEGRDDASQYNIYRRKEGESSFKRVGFTGERRFVDSNLKPETTYYYAVTQIVDFNESEKSASVMAKTHLGPPVGIKAEVFDFQENLELEVFLTWDYMKGVDSYTVYRTRDRGGIYNEIGSTTREEFSDKDLMPETTYYYVVTQTTKGNESSYSEVVTIKTGEKWACGDILSYDNQDYGTVLIGEQCWVSENLNVSEDNDINCRVERYCYDNDLMMCRNYGGLYDYSSASCGQNFEGAQGICPLGWRIPTDEDWGKLEAEMGMREDEIFDSGFRGINEGSSLAGRYDLWKDGLLRRDSAFGSSGLNILPGGYQPAFNLRLFYELGEKSIFWSSTRVNEENWCNIWEPAYAVRGISYNETGIERDCHSHVGTAYLRCMRDY